VPEAPSTAEEPDDEGSQEDALSSADVRKKAASGAVLVSLRSFAVRGLGFVGNLVLARLLAPEDFGILAFGLTLILFGSFFADAGIAAGLIRRNQAPRRFELQSILGFQVVVATVLVLGVAVVAVPLGRGGQVATLMVASVIVSAWRAPATLVLERRLDYRALAMVEVVEGLVYVSTSITAVLLGAGVWGVAGAHVVRALAGSILMIRRSPIRVFVPRLRMSVIKELLGFGLIVQTGWLVHIVRLQVINLVTAGVAGLPVLGLYSLADRIMQLPWLVFESIVRVAFPAMARLVSAGEDARADIERGLRFLNVTAGFLLALVAATAPVLVSSFFGERWAPAADAIPLIALGMLMTGPLVAMGNGYLYAVGDATKVLIASSSHGVAWVVVAVPLLPRIGATAVGAGLLAGYTVQGLVLANALHRRTGLRCFRLAAPTSAAIIAAGAIGWLVARELEPSVVATFGVSALTAGLAALGLMVTARPTLRQGVKLLSDQVSARRAAPSAG
jgi:O-antigen/teichoic acid export membrane protein